MEIRWNNVIALALAVFALVVAVKAHGQIGAFLSTMTAVGPLHSPEERTMGLVAFGLVIICTVAVVAILQTNRRDP